MHRTLFLILALAAVNSALAFNCSNAAVDCANQGVCSSPTSCACFRGVITYQAPPNVQCNSRRP